MQQTILTAAVTTQYSDTGIKEPTQRQQRPFISSLVVDEGRIRPDHWMRLVTVILSCYTMIAY